MKPSSLMRPAQYWLTCALGAASVIVVAGNMLLATANKGLQTDLSMRQQYVQQSVQLEGLYREIVRALAELGARNQDNDVKALLERHGISYQSGTPAPTQGSAGSSGAPRK